MKDPEKAKQQFQSTVSAAIHASLTDGASKADIIAILDTMKMDFYLALREEHQAAVRLSKMSKVQPVHFDPKLPPQWPPKN